MSSVTTQAEVTAAPVSVQLTPIVPIRVFNPHGDYFDTEMDIDAPLRSLQLAVEDYFKLKPEVQLLLHNRQQIHADRSLRDNGCLLLKGDPYVKLVCLLKRGPILNLQCEVGPVTYVVACHEATTVWEVKQMLCEEMERQQRRADPADAGPRRLACGPERLRLLWRYMELNDRASLHYYRISTNAVLTVMHRRRVSAPAGAATASPSNRETGLNRTVVVQHPSTKVWWQAHPAAPASPSSVVYDPAVPPTSALETGVAHSSAEGYMPPPLPLPPRPPGPLPPTALPPAALPPAALPPAALPPAALPPTALPPTALPPAALPPAALPPAALPPTALPPTALPPTALPPAALPPTVGAPVNLYAGAALQQCSQDPLTSSEVVSLSLAVRSLEAQLHSLRQEQRQVEQYQQSLSAYQRGSLADAQQRILELEETVKRFHALLERAVALIPAAA